MCNVAWTTTDGTLSSASGKTTCLTAPDEPGSVTITAELAQVSGSSTQASGSITLEVVEPDGVRFELINNLPDGTNELSGGFLAKYHILPDDVNFTKLSVSENEAYAITSGYYLYQFNLLHVTCEKTFSRTYLL